MRTRALMFESCFSLSKTRTQDDVCWNQMLPWRNATQMNGEKKRNTQQYHKSRLVSSVLKEIYYTYVKYINVYIYISNTYTHVQSISTSHLPHHPESVHQTEQTLLYSGLTSKQLRTITPANSSEANCWFACNGEQEPINRTSWDAWLVLMDSGDSWMYRPLPTYP